MNPILGPILVFLLRIVDVPAGTIRVIYMVRGQRMKATLLSLVESGAYIFAIVNVGQELNSPAKIVAYMCGYAVGTFVGITLEQWLASGWALARIASRKRAPVLTERLRHEQFGVTIVHAEGREGEVSILFIVCPRSRTAQILRLVQEIDPEAFVTIDPVSQAIGGYLPRVATPVLVGK